MGMGKLFTAMFVKIVDIGFCLRLFDFLVLISMLLYYWFHTSVLETKFSECSTIFAQILLVDQVSEFFFKANYHCIKSARTSKVIFVLILAVIIQLILY